MLVRKHVTHHKTKVENHSYRTHRYKTRHVLVAESNKVIYVYEIVLLYYYLSFGKRMQALFLNGGC